MAFFGDFGRLSRDIKRLFLNKDAKDKPFTGQAATLTQSTLLGAGKGVAAGALSGNPYAIIGGGMLGAAKGASEGLSESQQSQAENTSSIQAEINRVKGLEDALAAQKNKASKRTGRSGTILTSTSQQPSLI